MPWIEITSALCLKPVATYASTVLYNCIATKKKSPLSPEDFQVTFTSTGTVDEAWFYQISAAIDSYSPKAMHCALSLLAAVDAHQFDAIFQELTQTIKSITSILKRMYERCEAGVFYGKVRKYLAGWLNEPEFIANGGLTYTLDGREETLALAGGSASQNSLIQLLDIALGIRHRDAYLMEMQSYMPRAHKEFLQWLEAEFSNRAIDYSSASAEECINSLRTFRRVHLSMVRHYIVSEAEKEGDANPRGTGGSDAISFLTNLADATK